MIAMCVKPGCHIPTLNGFCDRHSAPLGRSIAELSDAALAALTETVTGLVKSEPDR